MNSAMIEMIPAKYIESVIDNIAKIIPNIRGLIVHVLNVAYDPQSDNRDTNMRKVNVFSDGLCSSCVCIHVSNNIIHHEDNSI